MPEEVETFLTFHIVLCDKCAENKRSEKLQFYKSLIYSNYNRKQSLNHRKVIADKFTPPNHLWCFENVHENDSIALLSFLNPMAVSTDYSHEEGKEISLGDQT